MKKVGLVAKREFVTTIKNKGFLIGLLAMPVLILVLVALVPRILDDRATPQVRGDIAIIDPTGRVVTGLRTALDPAVLAQRRTATARQALSNVPSGTAQAAATAAIENALGQVPVLRLVERPGTADLEVEKAWLLEASPDAPRLALVAIHPDAVEPAGLDSAYGTYDLFVSGTLSQAVQATLTTGVRDAIVGARLDGRGLQQETIEALMRVPAPDSLIVTATGDRPARPGFTRSLPFILGILLFMGVMIGGQSLMTSTIEEKSSRVIEVLLAAVSPIELMAGKLIGQLGVGLLILAVYTGLGVLALLSFAMFGLLEPSLIVYLLVFFLITYLFFGALMMAIGAAVNQMNEAQALMGPVMVLLIGPYILTPIIGQAPNAPFSVVMSFIPPVNAFAMMARLASDTPPPVWQVGLTVLAGLAAAAGAIWFAAKIFKIGLLMHGKPPDIKTLIRWARAA